MGAKIRISRAECQIYLSIPEAEVSKAEPKIRKVERRSKRQLDYAETEYLRRKPMYEKSSAEASVSLIMPRRSIFNEVKDTNKPQQRIGFLLSGNAFDEDVSKHMLIRINGPSAVFWRFREPRGPQSPPAEARRIRLSPGVPRRLRSAHTLTGRMQNRQKRGMFRMSIIICPDAVFWSKPMCA